MRYRTLETAPKYEKQTKRASVVSTLKPFAEATSVKGWSHAEMPCFPKNCASQPADDPAGLSARAGDPAARAHHGEGGGR